MGCALQADNVSAGAGPGSYALPDILRLGEGGQSMEEYQSQISMYTVLAAPLICGEPLALVWNVWGGDGVDIWWGGWVGAGGRHGPAPGLARSRPPLH
jgi:hypothetical protein